MPELELQQYLLREYPQENARCEWKEFKNLNRSVGREGRCDFLRVGYRQHGGRAPCDRCKG